MRTLYKTTVGWMSVICTSIIPTNRATTSLDTGTDVYTTVCSSILVGSLCTYFCVGLARLTSILNMSISQSTCEKRLERNIDSWRAALRAKMLCCYTVKSCVTAAGCVRFPNLFSAVLYVGLGSRCSPVLPMCIEPGLHTVDWTAH